MRNTILYPSFSLILGIEVAFGQNITLEKQVNIVLWIPVADIDDDGIPELIGYDPVNEIEALYDGATLEKKYTLPPSAWSAIDEEVLMLTGNQYVISPFLDFNNDGKKDVLFISYYNYKVTGFTVHDIVNNSTIYEYVDPYTGSYEDSWGQSYLADIDGDSEIEIVLYLTFESPGMYYKSLVFSTGVPLDLSQQSIAPMNYRLFQNYPNPFNPSTNIKYSLPKQGHVVIIVYNIKGQVVDRLVDRAQSPGHHMTRWNAKQLSSELYFCQIIVDDKPIATRKAIYLK